MRIFIQITGLIVTLWSAIFLAKGNLGLSPEQIAQLSSTKWDYNPELIRSFAEQRSETWIGVVFLLLAFGLQLAHEFWPERESGVGGRRRSAVLSAILFSVALFVGGWFFASANATTTERNVKRILDEALHPGATAPR